MQRSFEHTRDPICLDLCQHPATIAPLLSLRERERHHHIDITARDIHLAMFNAYIATGITLYAYLLWLLSLWHETTSPHEKSLWTASIASAIPVTSPLAPPIPVISNFATER